MNITEKKFKYWKEVIGTIIAILLFFVGKGIQIGEYKSKIENLETDMKQVLLIKERISICENDILILKTKYETEKIEDNNVKKEIKEALEKQNQILKQLSENVAVLNERTTRK